MSSGKGKKIAAFLLCFLMVWNLSFGMTAQASEGAVIHIASREDWEQFAKDCKLDSWSVGKQVVLDTDLDLSAEFHPIPIFSGTFDGDGHTIHVGSYLSDASDMGVFRYLESGASISRLTVTGTWQPSGRQEHIGGIVGNNRGTIEYCMFNGVVDGQNQVGGIAGVNETGGMIRNCIVRGEIRGEHDTGGVAGQNLGTIQRCTNESSVNTDGETVAPTLEELDLTQINQTENISAYTDTGGIAGFSSGLIQGCENIGKIGYPHVGYNVGGIAGRQSGYLHDCENKGAVYGRKDVGGIVGQMEPYMILRFSKDDLERLSDGFSALQDIMDGMLDHVEGTMDGVSEHMDSIAALTDEARGTTEDLVQRTEDYVDDAIEEVNDLGQRVDRFLADLENILGEGEAVADDITEAVDQLHRSVSRLQDAADAGQDAVDHVDDGISTLDRAAQNYKDAWQNVSWSVQDVMGSVGNEGAMAEALAELQVSVDSLADAGDGLKRAAQNTKNEMEDAWDSGEDVVTDLESALSRLERSVEQLQDIQGGLSDIVTDFRWAIRDFREDGAVEFPVPDAGYKEQIDNLMEQTGSMFDEMEDMTEQLDGDGDAILSDLRAMNQQMREMMDIIRDMYDKLLNDGEEDWYEDISEENSTSTEGVVEQCRNYGVVEGDVDTGGICGAIAVEYDFDPEGDLTREGNTSLERSYLTKAVLREAVNYGSVTGRKDYVGGIVGYMKLGSLYHCEAYGKIVSENGDYIGGIAGSSESVIRDSAAKVSLEGDAYVGGIVGSGMDIYRCCAMPEIQETGEAAGAIAGKAEGDVVENYFLEGDWGGVDDISYVGKAEPMAYADFIALERLPERFRFCYLIFMSNGAVIEEVAYEYGARTDSKSIPEVPYQAGYTGEWEELPETVMFDRVLEAVYTQRSSSIASKQTRADGVRAIILAEGSFATDDSISLERISEAEAAYTGWGIYAEGWRLRLPDDGNTVHTMRYCKPEESGWLRLYQMTGDGAELLDTEPDGQYVCFQAVGSDVAFYAVRIPYGYVIVPICAAAAAGLGILLFCKRKKLKKFVIHKHPEEE